MKRLALSVLIFSTFLGCAGPPQTTHHPVTLRPIGMTSEQFVEAADRIIIQRAPRWFAPETHEVKILIFWHDTGRYAGMGRRADGTYAIRLERSALVLPVIEDMAHVLMHEYIHVKVWEAVNSMDLTKQCKELRSEMIANKVMIEMYHIIGYRRALLTHAVGLYASSQAQARIRCPVEAWIDLPFWPIPRKVKERKLPNIEEFEREIENQREQDERTKVPVPFGRYPKVKRENLEGN